MFRFTTKKGEVLTGRLVYQYGAFEGGRRYVLETQDGRQYRCVKDSEGNFVEYVA